MTSPDSQPTRLACVGRDRQLHLHELGADGPERESQVTWSRLVGDLGGGPTPDGCAWPTWSPDGHWLAFFRLMPASGQRRLSAHLCVVEADGIEERELLEVEGGSPVYLRWSPDGGRLALLVHDGERLELRVVDVQTGASRVVEDGQPLFFSWTQDGESLLVHAGEPGSAEGRLTRRAVGGQGEDAVFPVQPGSFCAPLHLPGTDRVAFAVAGGGMVSHVCLSGVDGLDPAHVATLQGLLAVVPAPGGRRLAIGSAPRGERTPYDGIFVVDADGGRLVQVSAHPCMAFAWAGDDRHLVYAAMDAEQGCARWYRCTLGEDPAESEEQELAPFWPSGDQLFMLHFFEQFVGSHAQVSPDGRWLVYSSREAPDDDAASGEVLQPGRAAPQVMLIDLTEADPTPRRVARGSYAVFAPGQAPAG